MSASLRLRIIIAIISIFIILLPLLIVRFPPSADLPQHVSQVRLFLDTLKNPAGPYRILWGAPNNLVYALVGLGWVFGGPENAGRLTLIFLVALWTVGAAFLATRGGRPPETAVLLAVLVFNHSLYWGFFNFLLGWPAFILLFALTTRKTDKLPIWKEALLYLVFSFLLLQSHALWFAVGTAWIILHSIVRKIPVKIFIARLLGLFPCIVLSVIWYPSLSSSRITAGFGTAPHWILSPFERLLPQNVLNSTFGGLFGITESVIFIGIVAWMCISFLENRKNMVNVANRDALLAAGLFFAIAWLAPDKYMNTIYFASRWLPCGIAMLLLGIPSPFNKSWLRRMISFGLTGALVLSTAFTWSRWEKEEMSGLHEALTAIPSSSRVLGLDFVKESKFIKGRPFIQIFAYSQALKGGEVNFSFAEHSSGIVAFKERRRIQWTPGLEWFAEKVRISDLARFDYALVNGKKDIHDKFVDIKNLECVTNSGRWRLYRVLPVK